MIKTQTTSNAQSWELEIVCKNKKYLDAVVQAILKQGIINFEVEIVDGSWNSSDEWDGRYLVFLWCSWFSNLKSISEELSSIEAKFEGHEEDTK
jgi:hypothetical protein